MDEIVISGRSDDLIEVDGDVNDEIIATYDETTYLGINPTGTIVTVEYDTDGIWRVNTLCDIEHAPGDCTHIEQGDYSECEYSEAVRIIGENLSVEKHA